MALAWVIVHWSLRLAGERQDCLVWACMVSLSILPCLLWKLHHWWSLKSGGWTGRNVDVMIGRVLAPISSLIGKMDL